MEPTVKTDKYELYLGDCRQILPFLEPVDLLLTDPPYGIGEDGGKFRGRKGGGQRVLEKKTWDKERPKRLFFELMEAAADVRIYWGGNYFADYLPASKGWLYWNKLMGGDFSDGELAYTSMDKALKQFTYCNKEGGKVHPTQKPVPLMSWCLGFVPEAQTVLDPFMGSGTTGVACIKLGRKFIGIEREEKYFDIAVKRLEETAAQGILTPVEQGAAPDPLPPSLFAVAGQ